MTDLKSGGGKTVPENARGNLENTLKKLKTAHRALKGLLE
jgi:hypothetical protein